MDWAAHFHLPLDVDDFPFDFNVATANKPLRGRAVDSAWHPFVGRLATIPGVTTLPLNISGQNSRLFQIASHLSYPLRIALVFYETCRRINRPIDIAVGARTSTANT